MHPKRSQSWHIRFRLLFVTALWVKALFPVTDPLYTGMLGMHGTKTSDLGVTQCDLLIVLGARFSDRVTGNAKTFAKQCKDPSAGCRCR